MYEFSYHKPATADEAVQLFAQAEDPMYLAGGMTLIPTLKQRLAQPSDVIDLGGIKSLSGIAVAGDAVTIGALTSHSRVAASQQIGATLPVLAQLAAGIGDVQVRNRGTLGGSVANGDPAADYPAAIVALQATVATTNRELAGDAFFQDLFTTALEPGELLTQVRFAVPVAAAYRKFPNPASRYAVVGVLVARFADGVRVGVTGAGPCAYRALDIEARLNENFGTAALAGLEVDYTDFNSDLHATAAYRGHLVSVMATRAVADLGA